MITYAIIYDSFIYYFCKIHIVKCDSLRNQSYNNYTIYAIITNKRVTTIDKYNADIAFIITSL